MYIIIIFIADVFVSVNFGETALGWYYQNFSLLYYYDYMGVTKIIVLV